MFSPTVSREPICADYIFIITVTNTKRTNVVCGLAGVRLFRCVYTRFLSLFHKRHIFWLQQDAQPKSCNTRYTFFKYSLNWSSLLRKADQLIIWSSYRIIALCSRIVGNSQNFSSFGQRRSVPKRWILTNSDQSCNGSCLAHIIV